MVLSCREEFRTFVHRQHSLLHEKTGIVVSYTPGLPNQDVVLFDWPLSISDLCKISKRFQKSLCTLPENENLMHLKYLSRVATAFSPEMCPSATRLWVLVLE